MTVLNVKWKLKKSVIYSAHACTCYLVKLKNRAKYLIIGRSLQKFITKASMPHIITSLERQGKEPIKD